MVCSCQIWNFSSNLCPNHINFKWKGNLMSRGFLLVRTTIFILGDTKIRGISCRHKKKEESHLREKTTWLQLRTDKKRTIEGEGCRRLLFNLLQGYQCRRLEGDNKLGHKRNDNEELLKRKLVQFKLSILK